MKHAPGPRAAPEKMEPFQACMLLDTHYPLGPCRTETSSKEIQLNLHLVLCAELTGRKIHHGKQGDLHFINPQQPALNVSLPFASTNSGRILSSLLTSLAAFVPQAFKELHTCSLSSVTPSPVKDFKRTELQHGGKVNKEYKVRNVFTVYITVNAFAIMFAGRVNIVRLLSFFLRPREVQQLVPRDYKALTSTHASYAFAFAANQKDVFVVKGVLQCSALKNAVTFSTAGTNGSSKFNKILSFSALTGLGFWQVFFRKS